MSATGLTSEAQLRYILLWFNEFSELQREDFLPILASARGDPADQLAETLAALSRQDKPASLFQCRIKLFNEWYPTWAKEEQDRLIKGVSEADPEFGEKLQNYSTNGAPMNGDINGFFEAHSEEALKDEEVHNDDVENTEEENEPGIAQENLPVQPCETVAAS